jgi:hypothetical protein
MTQQCPSKKKYAYGLFTVAATIYAAGVIVFSVWSYHQQQATLLAHIDHSMLNATHATEQILGDIFIACAVETETVYDIGYIANKDELGRFASACNFDALGAVAIKGTNLWTLVGGIKPNGIIPESEVRFKDPIQSETVSAILRFVADPETENISVQNIHHESYGLLRIAIRYQSISPDTGYALITMLNIDDIHHAMRAQLNRKIINGLFLLLMAFPLVALYNRARVRSLKKLAELNELLKHDVEQRIEREKDLKDAIHDLERFNAVTVGRETRIIALKAEINTLLEQMKRKKRYNVAHVD